MPPPPSQEGSGRLGGPQPAPLADVHFRAPRPTLGDKRGTIGIRARHWQKRTSEPAAGAGRPDALPGSGRAEGDLLRLCGDRGRAADAGGGRGEQRPGSRAAAVLGSCALWSLDTRMPAVQSLLGTGHVHCHVGMNYCKPTNGSLHTQLAQKRGENET